MKKETWFYVIAVLAGALVWIVVAALSGRKEAWDSSWYFSVGYPLICLLSLALGIMAFAVVSVPGVIAAKVGAHFGTRRILEGEL